MQSSRFPALLAALAFACPAAAEDIESDSDSRVIVVTGQHSDYSQTSTATATKTDTPLINVPQTVTVLNRERLDDQAVAQLGDALRYVPGVVLSSGEGNRDQIVLRGQASTADFFLDGLRDDAQYYRPLYNTERVEVLKGANAMIFGRGGGGGVINRVSKTATFSAAKGTVVGSADSFGAWSLSGDVSQPLSDSISLRLNGTHEELDSHRDFYRGHFTGVAPTIGLKLGADTSLQLGYEYAEDSRLADRGVPSLNGLPISGYDRTFFGDPKVNQSLVKAHIARARLGHTFSDNLSANFTGQYATYDKFYGNIVPGTATATSVALTGYNNGVQRNNWITQGNLVWKGEAFGLRHTLLTGFEYSEQDTDSTRSDVRFTSPTGALLASVSVPLAQRLIIPTISFTAPTTASTSHVRTLSGYVQNQIEIGEHLQVVAGLRYDDFRITSLNLINRFAATRSDRKWSPRLGLIIKPRANLSIYASYAKGFLPQSGDQFTVLAANTVTLDPEAFCSLEAGVKWDVNSSLSLTGAMFQIDRSNTRVSDPANPGFFVVSGKSRVRGFEAAVNGRIMPDWQLSLGWSHQAGEIRSSITSGSNVIPAGRKLDKLPEDQVSLWSRYDVSGKLGLGLGLIHQSSQFATISNAVQVPAFARVDAAVFYEVSKVFALQLNVENVTGARYYPSAHNDTNIAPGKPINARITARVKF
jgi:catecholate siderophore receptor